MPALKYGINPQRAHAEMEPIAGAGPLEIMNGRPSFINVLDALNGWQLVREVRAALDLPAAASFKHVSPAGAAVANALPDDLARAYGVGEVDLTPAATAYVRARGADPKSSYGDMVALSDTVDLATARFLAGVVSDGIIAPGYDDEAFAVLSAKKGGNFIVLRADAEFEPPARESREVFGARLTQDADPVVISSRHLDNVVCGALTDDARRDLLLAMVAVKYTQSNSVGYAFDGQMIGIGAGQQSRVDCTKLAGAKAQLWHLMRHPRVLGLRFRKEVRRQDRINHRVRYVEGDLSRFEQAALADALTAPVDRLGDDEKAEWLAGLDGVSLASDGFIPFRDNIDHAQRFGVKFIAEPGGSIRGGEVQQACEEYGITLVHTGVRLFHH